ncbi:hypothetical protein FJTKL_14811 [Diaporthe vaccinii]|uniref:Cx9C motif-containing protein 4, mitochondrial n=1 Tax=Diaporthe vaccinii TaxID=105482 RepID=A0ABR4F833_9PEZI
MGLEEDLQAKPPCHPRACAIQDCLKRNTYKEDKCQGVIYELYDCCQAFYDRNGEGASAASCPKPDLLKMKLKMRKKTEAKPQ